MLNTHRKKIIFYKLIALSCILLIIGFITYKIITNKQNDGALEKNKLLQNYDLAIKKSVIDGEDPKGKSYKIESELVAQNSSGKYLMQNIQGFHDSQPNKVFFKSDNANMPDNRKIIQMRDNVKVNYGEYIIETDNLNFDMDNMLISNDSKTDLKHLNSHIKADQVTGDTNKRLWKLKGNVNTYIKLSDY